MTEEVLKEEANPYNAKKEWHNVEDKPFISSDSLFFAPEAEANAEEDKIFEEMVQARNSADTLIHSCKKTLEESADKVEEDEKTQIEEAITVLEKAMKGEDKQEIEDKTKALAEASSSLAQRLYAEQQENASTDQDSQESEASDDAAVDADFEEVKEEAKEQEK